MSDGVQVALIASVLGPLVLAIANHLLGQRDRLLANETVKAKNDQLDLLEQRVVTLEADKVLLAAQVAALRSENQALMGRPT